MDEQLKKMLTSAKDFWKKQSKKQKITYGAVLGGIAAIAIIFAVVVNIINGQYIVVAEGLDSTESSEILTLLQENNIRAVIENGGVIKVPKANEYETIMKLYTAGYPKDISDYSIFKDNVSLTSTEFEQNQYARFQTQEYIRAAIKTIPGVKEALVQLAESEDDRYVLVSEKVDTKAWAKVDMSAGYELTASQVRGIESLIANSVTGLTVDNVSVVDRNGQLLSSDDVDFVTDANTKRRLQYEKQIEDGLKKKVVDILKGPFGENGISVAVTAILDYDRMISEELNYVPSVDDRGMVNHEDYSSVTDSNKTEAGVPGVETNAEIPQYPDVNGGTGSNYNENSRSIDYLVSYIKTQTEKDGAARKAVTISVMIDREVMTDEERASVQSAVAAAAGVDTYNVSVTNMSFKSGPLDGLVPERQLNTTMIIIVGVSVLAFIIILIIVISLLVKNHKRKKDLMDMVAAGEAQIDDINQYFGPQQPKQDVSVAKLEVTDTKDAALKREIQTFAGENPDIAAQLLRTWLKGEDEDGFY